jgi:hypothetical protein
MPDNTFSIDDAPRVPVAYFTVTRSLAPITEPVTKLGGAPVLFEDTDWPVCKQCNRPLQFLGQLRLDDPLPLSDEYQMAYIFMCHAGGDDDPPTWDGCWTWGSELGANAVIVQRAAADGPVVLADPSAPSFADWTVALEHTTEPDIDTTKTYPWEVLEPLCVAKVGGVPYWIQDSEIPRCPNCHRMTRYIAQLSYTYHAEGSASQDDYLDFNFGDAGKAYVFLCKQACGPRGAAMLWQCG